MNCKSKAWTIAIQVCSIFSQKNSDYWLRRVEICLVGRADYCTDVRAAMSGIADPET